MRFYVLTLTIIQLWKTQMIALLRMAAMRMILAAKMCTIVKARFVTKVQVQSWMEVQIAENLPEVWKRIVMHLEKSEFNR